MTMNKKKKEYCVHIYREGDYDDMVEMEGIMAHNEKEARKMAIDMYIVETIGSTEAMRVHHCTKDYACDNDIKNKTCDNCGKKL